MAPKMFRLEFSGFSNFYSEILIHFPFIVGPLVFRVPPDEKVKVYKGYLLGWAQEGKEKETSLLDYYIAEPVSY